MKIGLFGQFGSGNTGNDGSLEAMLQLLKRNCPDAQLMCICSRPDVIREKFGIDTAPVGRPASKNAVIRAINKCLAQLPRRLTGFFGAITLAHGIDLFIVPGTGILDDYNEEPFGWPFAVLRWSLAAKLAGSRFAFISIGAGPVTHPLSRMFIRKASTMATYRSYRDQNSYDFMRSLNINVTKDAVTADIAFSLPVAQDEEHRSFHQRIGLGIMTYRGWEKQSTDGASIYNTYLDKMAQLIDRLVSGGREVRLLTGDQGDTQAVRDLQNRIRISHLRQVVFEPASSLQDVMQQIAKTDIVIASRYHNVVCALLMERPVISIGYARKNDALLSDTGLSEFCHHIESFDPDRVLEQIDEIDSRKSELMRHITDGARLYRQKLAEQEDALCRDLLQTSR